MKGHLSSHLKRPFGIIGVNNKKTGVVFLGMGTVPTLKKTFQLCSSPTDTSMFGDVPQTSTGCRDHWKKRIEWDVQGRRKC